MFDDVCHLVVPAVVVLLIMFADGTGACAGRAVGEGGLFDAYVISRFTDRLAVCWGCGVLTFSVLCSYDVLSPLRCASQARISASW